MYEIWMYVRNVPALTVQICRGGWMCGRILAVSCSRRSSPPTSQSHSSGSSSPSVIITVLCGPWGPLDLKVNCFLIVGNIFLWYWFLNGPRFGVFGGNWNTVRATTRLHFLTSGVSLGAMYSKRQVARQLHLQKCFLHIVYKNCHYSILIVID